jgi:hypothetical protein
MTSTNCYPDRRLKVNTERMLLVAATVFIVVLVIFSIVSIDKARNEVQFLKGENDKLSTALLHATADKPEPIVVTEDPICEIAIPMVEDEDHRMWVTQFRGKLVEMFENYGYVWEWSERGMRVFLAYEYVEGVE